ncbi:hypothetical protein [Actinophytocola sp.]|uniref:hypothetical protein n=1 Tax=Actinophytocola sp. TaxID=1872138 RepID=UPI002D80C9B8|nr:hypothetical protein [Actinophytocola sp.]HET9143803.1 hypothetical protein [Actinophytocola sp.]
MTSDLIERTRTALEQFHDVNSDVDGTLTFRHGEVPCAVHAMELSEGLVVLSLTCVVAWDLPDDPALAVSAAERAGQGLFGTLGVVHTDRGMDVTLRYAFPADGLAPPALGTLLMLVVSTASQLRAELLHTGARQG